MGQPLAREPQSDHRKQELHVALGHEVRPHHRQFEGPRRREKKEAVFVGKKILTTKYQKLAIGPRRAQS